jgi:hypothetical protein
MPIFKHFALLIFTTFAGCTLFAQPVVKVYAFKQAVVPGTIPAGVTDENGKPSNTSGPGHLTDYFIYLSHSGKLFIAPITLWIKGKCYQFKTEVINNTPVTNVNYNIPNRPATTLLVPATSNKVTRLLVSDLPGTRCAASSAEKKHPLDVVVSFKWKNKTYYAHAAVLKTLEPALHQ